MHKIFLSYIVIWNFSLSCYDQSHRIDSTISYLYKKNLTREGKAALTNNNAWGQHTSRKQPTDG
jgi:hypothetical protein